jgi:hypothetical protein
MEALVTGVLLTAYKTLSRRMRSPRFWLLWLFVLVSATVITDQVSSGVSPGLAVFQQSMGFVLFYCFLPPELTEMEALRRYFNRLHVDALVKQGEGSKEFQIISEHLEGIENHES